MILASRIAEGSAVEVAAWRGGRLSMFLPCEEMRVMLAPAPTGITEAQVRNGTGWACDGAVVGGQSQGGSDGWRE
jgi:hypothetical protein